VGTAVIVKELHDFAKLYAPTVLCAVETQVHKVGAEGLRHTLGYDKPLRSVVVALREELLFSEIMKQILRFYHTHNIILMLLLQRGGLILGDSLVCTGKPQNLPTFQNVGYAEIYKIVVLTPLDVHW
jgi:hypothetical protein